MNTYRKKKLDQQLPAPPLRLRRRGDLARFLAPGDEPLEGDRLCGCGHLEADHRLDGPCAWCRRCPGFQLHPDYEPTAVLAPEDMP